ncbi:unnamed protein product [Chironomus riparius]|uniref:BTB domain-containing protein n=1 Tax=Chironomus riparius TaxID=315576 RepID=A0A9N9RPB4_9DIPT|nr:unnamed protein product [Chironomus riparius]
MTTVQQYCLRWNNHQPNFISVFSSLLLNETLVDVTLAAEGRQLQAHKVVLSACSSYFQSLFTTNPCKHPIVILKDVQYNDLKTMVDFMYYGEVNVSTEQLPQILKTAEMLKIKGLAEMPDAASVTKSDSKSSDHTDGNQSISGVESMWGSTESQQQAQQQQYHTIRRTPSPSNMSPATRRKRLRKTSTGSGSINISASIERIQDEQHQQQIQHQQQTTMDGRMMQKYSQQQSIDVPLSTFSAVSQTGAIANVRGMKINSSPENQMQHQQDPHEHIDESQHITEMKTEDLSCVNQSMPLDISTGTSTTPVSCPPTQQHSAQQSELLFTSCSSISSPSSPISLSLSSPAIITATTTNVVVGANNNNNNNNNTLSNLSAASKRGRLLIRQQRIKKDGDQTGDLETPEAGIYQEYLLSVPSSGARMERHASEPSPATSSGLITTSSSSSVSGNLLSVPTHTSYLIKQHSHPLLPSQSSSPSTSYTLTRQLSHPIQTISHQSSQIVSTVTSHGGHDIGHSGQLLQMHHHKSAPVRSQTLPHYTVTDMDFSSGNEKAQSSSNMTHSPTVVIIPDDHTTTVVQSHIPSQHTLYQKSSSHHHLQLPSIRVKSEELQRSISSPLSSTRSDLSFETTTRSSHCPTLRAGPALGCNFCWNTIDAHGRILRRKTKYHCPECQTNLCIVPCFQEYHERQSNEGSNETSSTKSSGLKSLKSSQTM